MRRPRDISSQEENFRVDDVAPNIGFIRRDPVQAEPIGTLILRPMRVVGFDQDCDGSLMPRLEVLDLDEISAGLDEPDPVFAAPDGGTYGNILTNCGMYPSSGFIITEQELREMIGRLD